MVNSIIKRNKKGMTFSQKFNPWMIILCKANKKIKNCKETLPFLLGLTF